MGLDRRSHRATGTQTFEIGDQAADELSFDATGDFDLPKTDSRRRRRPLPAVAAGYAPVALIALTGAAVGLVAGSRVLGAAAPGFPSVAHGAAESRSEVHTG